MFTVHVGEYSSLDYPSLEGGWIAEVESLEEFLKELESEYPAVGEIQQIRRGDFSGDYKVKAYEHVEL